MRAPGAIARPQVLSGEHSHDEGMSLDAARAPSG